VSGFKTLRIPFAGDRHNEHLNGRANVKMMVY